MLSLKATFICCLFGFVMFGLAQQTTRPVATPTVSTTADDPNPMQAILKEVKQIRASIPRSNLYSFNAEITLNARSGNLCLVIASLVIGHFLHPARCARSCTTARDVCG